MRKNGLFYLLSLLLVGLSCLGLSQTTSYVTAGGGTMVTIPDQPPVVALTFDDGPRANTTTRLLDGLALREVPATFFLVGEFIPENEPLIRRMAAEGHQVGVHSYSHIRITDLSKVQFDQEVARTRQELTAILGEGDYWLRPPYGIIDDSVLKWAESPVVLWSLDTLDWEDQNADRIVNQVVWQAKDGDIILFHDIYDSSVDSALRIIDALTERGFCFATVEQLLQDKDVTPENGVVYRQIQ